MMRVALLVGLAGALPGAPYQAGVATITITPREPIFLSGYANRTRPSEGVEHELKAKALALRDAKGSTVVIVTTDLIGLPRSLTDPVAARVQKAYGLDRAQVVFNSSHTHTGPLVGDNLRNLFDLDDRAAAVVDRYARKLADDLLTLVGAALQDLKPAELAFAHGQAHVARNRRALTGGAVRIGVNPRGPTDPDVPVLKVSGPDGQLRAVLFGYACHNTTLTGQFNRISGDYSGIAQAVIEEAHPGATALFLALCGADQNPEPRGTPELAEKHGQALAAEVHRVLAGSMTRVRGPLRAAFRIIDLEFAHHTRDMFVSRLEEKNPWRARHARMMLRAYDAGRPIRHYPYPVQAVAFGKDLVLVALGGEVVVDYALRVKKEFGSKGLIVAGYSNDVMSYIPSQRVLREGGYEASESMIYYGLPGPYRDDVEERIMGAIRQVLKRVGR